MIIWQCWSQLKNIDSSRIWAPTFGIPVRRSSTQGLEANFIQFKCTRHSRDNLTLIHERMCSVAIVFQNHPQRYTWTETFHDNLTLPKSTENCWLERHWNSHIRDTGLPLYLLSFRIHRDWRRVLSTRRIGIPKVWVFIRRWTGIPKVRVQIQFESAFFSWLRECHIIMKSFGSCISLRMILK